MADLYDLPSEIFRVIILLLVGSSDGTQSFARAMSVSKKFLSCMEDKQVLEALSFDNVSITNRWQTFLRSCNLLFKSAEVGNLSAQHLISKVLVVSSSYLCGNTELLVSLDPTQAENHEAASVAANNFVDRVKRKEAGRDLKGLLQGFLRRCSPSEMAEFGEQLTWCVRYLLVEDETTDHTRFFCSVIGMFMFGRDVDAGTKVKSCELRNTINEETEVMMELRRSRKTTRRAAAFALSIADMKRRCIYELGGSCQCCGFSEPNPSNYFEQCRLDALKEFAFFFDLE